MNQQKLYNNPCEKPLEVITCAKEDVATSENDIANSTVTFDFSGICTRFYLG
jgi:hypothetical protein